MKSILITLSIFLFAALQAVGAVTGVLTEATELEVTYEQNSLVAKVAFKLPNTTSTGDSYSGFVDFKVLVNGTQRDTGRSYSSVTVVRDITVPAIGEYDFTVICSNDNGEGAAAHLRSGVGYPTPSTTTVTAKAAGTGINVSWTPVTTDIYGDPLDAPLTYDVVRLPDNVTVATATSATSLTDNVALTDNAVAYSYEVTPIYHFVRAEASVSNTVAWGVMTPPYTEGFAERSSLDLYTLIDGDGDGYTWQYYYNELYLSSGKDDWFISPAIKVEAGQFYTFGLKARARSYEEPPHFALCWGLAPTAEAMTNIIIPDTEVSSEALTSYSEVLQMAASNNIYLGVRAIDAGWGLLATDLSISAPMPLTTPAKATGLTVTADADCALKAVITLNAPALNLGGQALASLDKVELLRDGVLIHTFDNVTPGQALSFTDDTMEEPAEYLYTVRALNASGTGPAVSVSAFIGINIPAAPKWAKATETATNGEVTIEWEPVTTFADGRPLDPSTVTYCIYTPTYNGDTKILNELTGNSVTFQAIMPGEEQYLFYYMITAENAAGENFNPAVTEMIPLGDPHQAPYEDSFPDLMPKYLYGQGTEEIYTYWDYASDSTYPGITTQDKDNGMYVLKGQETGWSAYLFSCKIALAPLDRPCVTFWVHNNADDKDNTIELLINDRSGWASAGKWTLSETGPTGWNRIAVPLTAYAGKEVQLKFVGTTVSSCRLLLDNLRVVNRYDRDMAIRSISFPDYIKAGNEASVEVDLSNEGLDAVPAFSLDLSIDGTVTESRKFENYASDNRSTERFTLSRDILSPSSEKVCVSITYPQDELTANNRAEQTVVTLFPDYPAVTDLSATYTEAAPSDITLSWSEPDMNIEIHDNVLDTFEDARDWATSGVGDWTFYDEDKGQIYGFGSWVYLPGGIDAGSLQSWWVMNGDFEQYKNHFEPILSTRAHSGSKYLAQMAVLKDETEIKCDDWAVSPRLSGRAQTVSFWARSFFDTDPETFEFHTSTSGNAVSDFTSMRTINAVPYEWTRYSFNLPEGTTYFAVRCISRDCFMLMLDDVDYYPYTLGTDLELVGFNIYRDGEKVNTAPVAKYKYEFPGDGAGHDYNVTAVYAERGESAMSNTATATLSGLNSVATSNVTVKGSTGCILIPGNPGAEVYGIDGRLVATSSAETIPASPGVYIVKAGHVTAKVIVK